MLGHCHPGGIGQLAGCHRLGDTADLGDRGLDIVDGASLDHPVELVGGAGVLTSGHRDPGFAAQAGNPGKVLGRENRLLQPHQIRPFEIVGPTEHLLRRPVAVDVIGQRDVRPDGGAAGQNMRQVDLVQLDGLIAFVDRARGDLAD